MSLQNADFLGAIHEIAVELAAEPTKTQAETIQVVAQSLAYVDPELGAVMIDQGNGPVAIRDYLAAELRKLPKPAKDAPPARPPVRNMRALSPADDGIAAMGRGWTDIRNAKTAKEAAAWPNPWISGPNYNRTRQTIIQNVSPHLADEHRKKAGIA